MQQICLTYFKFINAAQIPPDLPKTKLFWKLSKYWGLLLAQDSKIWTVCLIAKIASMNWSTLSQWPISITFVFLVTTLYIYRRHCFECFCCMKPASASENQQTSNNGPAIRSSGAETEGLMCETPTVSATVASPLLHIAMCSLKVTCQKSHTDIQVALIIK